MTSQYHENDKEKARQESKKTIYSNNFSLVPSYKQTFDHNSSHMPCYVQKWIPVLRGIIIYFGQIYGSGIDQ